MTRRGLPSIDHARGALLVDVAMALVVTGVLAAVSLGTFTDVFRARKSSADVELLLRAKQAVLQFALRNERLPCPDTSGTGYEGNGSACSGASYGALPVHALGLELPKLNSTEVLRYGVFRVPPNADLGAGAVVQSLSAGAGLMRLASGMLAASPSGQPYVPAMDPSGHADDCSATGDAPAFVIAIGAKEALGADACFPVPMPAQGAQIAVGRSEMAGWILSKFKSAG